MEAIWMQTTEQFGKKQQIKLICPENGLFLQIFWFEQNEKWLCEAVCLAAIG